MTEWSLLEGRTLEKAPALETRIVRRGEPLDLTYSNFDIPIMSRRARALLTEHFGDHIQDLPINFRPDGPRGYSVMNVTRRVRCIDERLSLVQRWSAHDAPEKAGEYRMVGQMVLSRRMLGDAPIFRPEGWTLVTVVSQRFVSFIERYKLTGVKFEQLEVA